MIPWHRKISLLHSSRIEHSLEAKPALFRLMNHFDSYDSLSLGNNLSIKMLNNFGFRIYIPDTSASPGEGDLWGTVDGSIQESQSGSTIRLYMFLSQTFILLGLIVLVIAIFIEPLLCLWLSILFNFLYIRQKHKAAQKMERVEKKIRTALNN